MFFGLKKPKEKTVLVVDVESGSVGAALVRISTKEKPKIFGERRIYLNVHQTRDTSLLARDVERATINAVGEVSEVASRLRLKPQTESIGTIDSASLFLSAPWGMPDLKLGKPSFIDSLVRALHGLVGTYFATVPVGIYTQAGAVARGLRVISMANEPIIVCTVHGEVTELLYLHNNTVVGHATFPFGTHSLIRTLRIHMGITENEARSLLRLTEQRHHEEPLSAAAGHFRELFREAGEPLLAGTTVENVFVFARGPEASWFARSLTHVSMSDLFPTGGKVQLLRSHHIAPFVAAHAAEPDSALLLGALFVDEF